jgi:heme/copper-type cytochrome/quinol oxidase subunit 3
MFLWGVFVISLFWSLLFPCCSSLCFILLVWFSLFVVLLVWFLSFCLFYLFVFFVCLFFLLDWLLPSFVGLLLGFIPCAVCLCSSALVCWVVFSPSTTPLWGPFWGPSGGPLAPLGWLERPFYCCSDAILRPLHSLYLSCCSGLCAGVLILGSGIVHASIALANGSITACTGAQVILASACICAWVRSHYSSDSSSGSSSSYQSTVLYSCSWVALVCSECALFSGVIGQSAKSAWTWAAVNLQTLTESVSSAVGLSEVITSQPEQSLTAYNSALLWCSGVVAVQLLSEWSRGSSPATVASNVLILVLSGAFMSVQSSEYQGVHWCIVAAGACTIYYLLTGLHGSHVLLGHGLLAGGYLTSVASSLWSTVDIVSVCGLSGLLFYWHFVDGIWLVVGYSAYIGGLLASS